MNKRVRTSIKIMKNVLYLAALAKRIVGQILFLAYLLIRLRTIERVSKHIIVCLLKTE